MELKPQKQSSQLKKLLSKSLIFLIVVLAGLVRLYKLNTPLADWHSWRQADTVSVAREYVKNGIDLTQPKYMDLSDIPSGKDNPEGFRMVEFPLISAKIAWVYSHFPLQNIPLHVVYRLTSILFSLGSVYIIYKIVQLFEGEKIALLSSLIFAILPYSIFYSRTTLPENPLVFFSLLAVYSLVTYFYTPNHSLKNPWYWSGVVSAAIALLIKPTAIFFALPALYIGVSTCKWNFFKDKKTYLFAFLTILPLVVWRWWIGHFPEGIPAFDWLLNGNNIRFKGAFFRWIFADRIGRLILGYWGIVLLTLGLLGAKAHKKNFHSSGFFAIWLASMLGYVTIFATGNVQHDYYQIILIPIISIYVAKGVGFLLDAPKLYKFSRLTSYLLLMVISAFTMAFSWYEVRGYYQINNPAIVTAGQAVDKIAEVDALVVAPYMGDTAFLYQTNRRGWPVGGQIEKRIEQGADYYVTTTLDDEAKTLMEKFEVIESNELFTIINLHKETPPEPDGILPLVETTPKPTPTLTPDLSPTSSPTSEIKLPPGLKKKQR